jgi:two-component system, OmpR family, alkaline phosphatase synthesis response regulator PhoP
MAEDNQKDNKRNRFPKLLIVQQENQKCFELETALAGFDAQIFYCSGSRETYQYLKEEIPDLLLLFAELKGTDTVSFCHDFRRLHPWIPILVIMEENNSERRIAFLDSGADDCIVQPFDQDELIARLRRALRRFQELYDYYQLERTSCELDAIGLVMNPDKWEARFKGVLMDLSKTEFKLLELFCLHPNETLSRAILVQKVWRAKPPSSPRTIDNFVMRLRKKLNQAVSETRTPAEDVQLITVHGLGYQLKARQLKGQQQKSQGGK